VSLKAARFEFEFLLKDRLILPLYKGAVIRGGFGVAFRKVVCIQPSKKCTECLIRSKCPYAYIFETEAVIENSMIPLNRKAPHPFVIEPPEENRTEYNRGDKIVFHVVLIGRALDYLPYFVYTFERLANMGIGKERIKCDLTGVWTKQQGNKKKIYSGENKILNKGFTVSALLPNKTEKLEKINIGLITPTRIKHNGKLIAELPFTVLMRSLIRRIHFLDLFHGSGKGIEDYKELIEKSQKVTVSRSDLHWTDWERYSTRQKVKMKLGGVVGNVSYEGNLTPFLPYLHFGQIVHVGKGTSFGLGRYEITY